MESPRTRFEQIALRELERRWEYCATRFGWKGRLTLPVLKLHDSREKLGTWTSKTREMSFSRDLVYERSWNETLEVLMHEMAHQFCDEILHAEDAPHGKTFQAVCHQHNIDAAPRGIPDATSSDAPNHIVEKIRRLLDLASGGANPNECERAAEAAHNLMLKYNIELRERNAAQNYRARFLGRPVGRIQEFHSDIASLLSNHYFVKTLWTPGFNTRTGKEGYELEITGTPENLDVAEYIYEFLHREALAAWERTRVSDKFAEVRDDQLENESWRVPQTRHGYTLRARTNFLAGFISGFRSQLQQARIQEEKAGLVLAKDPGLEAFYKERHPKTTTFGGSGGGSVIATWISQGHAAGRSLNVPPAARSAKTTPLLGRG